MCVLNPCLQVVHSQGIIHAASRSAQLQQTIVRVGVECHTATQELVKYLCMRVQWAEER